MDIEPIRPTVNTHYIIERPFPHSLLPLTPPTATVANDANPKCRLYSRPNWKTAVSPLIFFTIIYASR
ncbi:hypothetical protein [Candidatus Leptofilum sp.]|uniref:hypothetical protein n=1 Tax=Candidatus Leptofilum sp. TaxID=3241576 RepID=UPI003B5C962B